MSISDGSVLTGTFIALLNSQILTWHPGSSPARVYDLIKDFSFKHVGKNRDDPNAREVNHGKDSNHKWGY